MNPLCTKLLGVIYGPSLSGMVQAQSPPEASRRLVQVGVVIRSGCRTKTPEADVFVLIDLMFLERVRHLTLVLLFRSMHS